MREKKPSWAYNKDYFQKALLRRDWYLHREEETFSESSHHTSSSCNDFTTELQL